MQSLFNVLTMKILIVTPSWKILGGVANHYQGLAPYWTENISYVIQGKRQHISAVFTLIPDYFRYVWSLIFHRPDVVIVNPSLRWYQLVRDCLYVIIALMLRIKVVTFIHGWSPDVAASISNHPYWFRKTFGKSAFIYVLYSKFKETLDNLNLQAPVLLTTTKVADNLVKNFDVKCRGGKIDNILFLTRIEIIKGIVTTLQCFKELKEKYPNVKLSVCGTGTALPLAKEFVSRYNLKDVTFYGNVSGDNKIEQFENADVYILPTYGEGMATSVLEAMAFGLPVLTCPVGGVNDFFEEGKMGFFIESQNASTSIVKLEWMINNPDKVKSMSLLNAAYAKHNFLASAVAKRFENDIKRLSDEG